MGVQLIAPLKSLPLSVSKRFMAICRTKERLLRKKNQFNGADNNGIVFFSSDQLSSVAKFCPAVCDPMDCSPQGSFVHGDSPGKNTGMGCHALLQGIFWTQGLNPGLLHCRWILYHLSHQGSSKEKSSKYVLAGVCVCVHGGWLAWWSMVISIIFRSETWIMKGPNLKRYEGRALLVKRDTGTTALHWEPFNFSLFFFFLSTFPKYWPSSIPSTSFPMT